MTRLLALLCLLGLASCKRASAPADKDAKVLARVNGETITERDLNAAAVKALGPRFAGTLSSDQRRKLLEGLVLGRVMARKSEATLTPVEREDLERRVREHREQLLIEHYLATRAKLAAPTAEDVRKYYEAHPERFGGGSVRSYELLVGVRDVPEEQRAKMTAALRAAPSRKDWPKLAQELDKQGLPLAHQRHDGGEDAVHPRLAQLMRGTKLGETSALAFIEGRPYMVRVTAETAKPARPLEEVSGEIRDALLARAKSKAIEEVQAQVLAEGEVEYPK